jgi:signal transduction histidine kinase
MSMTKQRPIGLTLFQKGLALIVIPFVFNCAWLFLLSGVMVQTNRLAERERNQSVFVEHLNQVMDCSFQSRQSLLGYLTTRKKKYLERADQWIKRTTNALSQLTALTDLSPDQRALTDQLAETLDGQMTQIRSVLKTWEGESSSAVLDDIEGVGDRVGLVLGPEATAALDVTARISKQRNDLEDARRQMRNNNSRATTIVWSGLFGNLLVTVLLILVLNVNLSKRLAILVENAQRLPRKQQLNAPLSGADELSFLDGSLHQASVELYKAAEFRTSLMQMVAHDLRSPLFSCLIALEVILDSENENLTPKGQRQVEAMQRNLDRLIGLTNDLLLIEQYENDQLKLDLNPENIQEMVDQALTAVEALAKSKTVTLRNLAAREYVNVDRNRILQVLVNYLSNAIKFSPPDSIVEVSSDIQATKVRLVVRDHGKGLSVSDKNKLFQKFFQTADGKTAGGAGLGLAICKSIVKAHGGEVGVSSEVGRGASFWFSIPVERV